MLSAPNKNRIKISVERADGAFIPTPFLCGASHHHPESLWARDLILPRSGSLETKERTVRLLGHSGIRNGEHQGVLRSEPAQSVGSHEDDRSLAAVMREIAWSLAGWLGFVAAVQLLLHVFRIA
jgi:hypothetical protein